VRGGGCRRSITARGFCYLRPRLVLAGRETQDEARAHRQWHQETIYREIPLEYVFGREDNAAAFRDRKSHAGALSPERSVSSSSGRPGFWLA